MGYAVKKCQKKFQITNSDHGGCAKMKITICIFSKCLHFSRLLNTSCIIKTFKKIVSRYRKCSLNFDAHYFSNIIWEYSYYNVVLHKHFRFPRQLLYIIKLLKFISKHFVLVYEIISS